MTKTKLKYIKEKATVTPAIFGAIYLPKYVSLQKVLLAQPTASNFVTGLDWGLIHRSDAETIKQQNIKGIFPQLQ